MRNVPFFVRFANENATGVVPFELAVKVGDTTLRASGTVARARWKVAFYRWDPKTQDPRKGEDKWRAILAAPPCDELATSRLDFTWGGAAPTPKTPADHFATVAETEMELPAGEFEITTISDDGVRVLIDGKLIQEDWTWHPPKENRVETALAAGKHKIRVEHFEIDGHAALSFSIRPR